jgi:beta-lactamase class A
VDRQELVSATRIEADADAALHEAIGSALDAAGLREHAHAVVIDLQRSRFGQWRGGDDVYPASVVKVPVMTEAFRRFAQGELDPKTAVEVAAANQTTTWGGATPFQPGSRVMLSRLVERMITHSDNVATNQLFDVLGRERVTEAMRALGLSAFRLGRKLSGSDPLIDDPQMTGTNRLPPIEIATLLALIARDRVPGAAAQRSLLLECLDDEKLVPGLLPGDRFAHKTGETSTQNHDAGILETSIGRRYVVVLYTTRPSSGGMETHTMNRRMQHWMREVRTSL